MGMHISLGIIFPCMLQVYFGKQMTGGCQGWGEIYVPVESSWKERKWLGPVERPQQNVNLFLAPGEVGKCHTNNSSGNMVSKLRVDARRGARPERAWRGHTLHFLQEAEEQKHLDRMAGFRMPRQMPCECQLKRAPWITFSSQSLPHVGTKRSFFLYRWHIAGDSGEGHWTYGPCGFSDPWSTVEAPTWMPTKPHLGGPL